MPVLLLVTAVFATAGCSGEDGDSSATPTPASASSAQHSDSVEALLGRGLTQVEAGQYDEASATFQTVLDQDPDNINAWYNLGYVAQLTGDDATAVERYTTALTHNKDFAPALYNLAILTEGSDLDGAAALYRRVIAIKPDDAAAHMRLGFALRHLGDVAEAENLLARGLELDPAMANVTPPTYR